MKQHVIYECEICGKQSENRKEIRRCEASHYGKKNRERLREICNNATKQILG